MVNYAEEDRKRTNTKAAALQNYAEKRFLA